MPVPSIVPTACPIIRDPFVESASRDELQPLTEHLKTLRGLDVVPHEIQFRRGAVSTDGRLDLCKQGLRIEGTQFVLDQLTGTPIRHLLLGTNGLGSGGVQAVADALANGLEVETLYLGCNKIVANDVRPLTNALIDSRSIKGLWLKRNPLGPAGISAVADLVLSNKSLESLDLVNTEMDLRGLEQLVDAITQTKAPIHTLFLSGNGIGIDGCKVLAPLLCSPRLKRLALSVNPLADDGLAFLAWQPKREPSQWSLGLHLPGLGRLRVNR